jgi:hypothetical protein
MCPTCIARAETARGRYPKQNREVGGEAPPASPRFTVDEDETLRRIYSRIKLENNAYKQAQKELPHRTAGQIFRRSAELGIIRRRERVRWSDEELAVVEQYASHSLEIIQDKLVGVSPPNITRTRSAIAGQIHALRFRSHLDGWDHQTLADALGMARDTLHKIRDQGLLVGRKLAPIDDRVIKRGVAPVRWFYPQEEVFLFILRHPLRFDFRRVNQEWFMSLVAWGSRLTP